MMGGLFLALVGSAMSADFKQGLVLYLPLDEGKGNAVKDISGKGHNGEVQNPQWGEGRFGKALLFGGEASGTFVSVKSTEQLKLNEMTFMAWVHPNTWDGVKQVAGKSVHGGCAGRAQWGIFSEGGALVFRLETAAGRVNVSGPLPGTKLWTHLAATNDGKMAVLYADGKEIGNAAISGKLNVNDDPLAVGQDCDRLNYIFEGLIDEVRLWNRALSVAEIADYGGKGSEALAVEPHGKLSTVWGQLRAND
jgi:hypothetical protein